MTTLVFLLAIAAILGGVLAIEGVGTDSSGIRRPTGLLTWITSGNWPAKIGAGLLIVGVGALLRYAAINFDVPPPAKLTFGAVAAGLLGFASLLTSKSAAQRSVSLALGGAAFGIAYLTAYSAFGLFGYVTSATGLTLLALTSVAAGMFAVTRSALSLALLAMVGAYLAPAFAIGDPGPRVVYGYLAAASFLTLLMVTARGWRPLIHVSFLFTLAGSVFFAWTEQYYAPVHFDVMWPRLVLLVALHVAMPIAEQRHQRGPWIERLDIIYLLTLPVIAALLATIIAPSRLELSWELMGLGTIWLAAAGYLRILSRDGFAAHLVIGAVLIGLGVAARFRGLPWELITLGFSVAALAFAARRSQSGRLHDFLAGLVLLLGAVHVVSSLAPISDRPVFVNWAFAERLVSAALLIIAGRICRNIRQSLDTLLLAVGICWAIIAIGAEIVRWDLVSFALIVHWLLIAAAIAVAVLGARAPATESFVIPIAVAIAATAIFAGSAPIAATWITLCAAPLALIALAVRSGASDNDSSGRVAAAIVVPVVAALWAQRAGHDAGLTDGHFVLAIAALSAVATLLAGRAFPERSVGWVPAIAGIFAVGFAVTLATVTLLNIVRSPWAVGLELICLGGLGVLALKSHGTRDVGEWIGPACIIGAALLLQANLLRLFGPPGDMTLGDIAHMRLPTLVSLLWAAMGAALTVWGRQSTSRMLWVSGAALLVAAAVKLVLVDFGSLGELTNILAVIAAGGMFLLVGWLAPMPPAAEVKAAPKTAPPPTQREAPARAPTPPQRAPAERVAPVHVGKQIPQEGPATREGLVMPESYGKRPSGQSVSNTSSSRKIGWIIALIAAVVLLSSRFGHRVLEFIHDAVRRDVASVSEPAPMPLQEQGFTPSVESPTTVAPAPEQYQAAMPESSEPPPQAAPPAVESECTQWVAQLPDDYVIHAAGAYKGRELDFTFGEANKVATAFDVAVNVPDRDVVLALGAYDPGIWTVKWSPGTRIVGVWVSGHDRQEVIGIDSSTPLLKTSYADRSACPSFYVTADNAYLITGAVSKVLGRAPDSLVLANNGRISIGKPGAQSGYIQAERKDPEEFRDPSLPSPGDKGIEQLLSQGKLRRATVADLRPGDSAAGSSESYVWRAFVVLGPMRFPADL